MSLNKIEKRTIFTALSFFHDFGKYWVDILPNATKEENAAAWEKAREICKELMKRIEPTL